MAKSVTKAFFNFLNDIVKTEPTNTSVARKSKNWLNNQIEILSKNGSFIRIASQFNIGFGSFARKTQIRPLDDIDLIIGLNGSNTTFYGSKWDDITVEVNGDTTDESLLSTSDRNPLGWDNSKYSINSNKVKNKLVSALRSVSQYEKSEIHARGEAVTLKFKSYDWTFDIVPAFYVLETYQSNPFYLIPNGKGKWKKTNPKLEQERVTKANKNFNNIVLNVIRLVKYWNRRAKMPNITSYVLETMVLDYFDNANHNKVTSDKTYDWVDIHFRDVLNYISNHI
ncbi:MAG: hypothetical protein UMR38_07505 [Candidatus Izemoplasma sp.]|nr:hypothetical protein [Candidatus Izemoplasma sp.]